MANQTQKKSRSIIAMIAYSLFALIGIYIMLVNLIMERRGQYWMYYDFPISNWILFAISLLIVIVLYFVIERLSNKKVLQYDKHFKLKIIVFAVILFVIECIIVHNIYFDLGWDVKYLRDAANEYVNNSITEFSKVYFENNPNNVFMLALTTLFIKIGEIFSFNGYMLLVYLGVLLNNLAVLFSALCVRKITNSDLKAYITFILAALLFGFSHWMIAAYSDVFSILIPVSSLYIFLCVREKKYKWFVKAILVVLLPSLTYMIKPTNLFFLFAVVVYEVVMLIKAPEKKYTVGKVLVGIITSIILIYVAKVAVYASINYEENESLKKPVSHYLLLGSNEGMVGMYSTPDDEYTNSFVGMEAKTEGDIKLIKERYSNMGLKGYLKHISRKTYLNYANGIFGWGKESGFIESISESDTAFGRFLQNIYYVGGDDLIFEVNSFGVGGKYFSVYTCLCQIIWYIVLLMCVVRSVEYVLLEINRKKAFGEKEDSKFVICIALLGMFLFLTIFETNARYLYSMLPLYVVYCNIKKSI